MTYVSRPARRDGMTEHLERSRHRINELHHPTNDSCCLICAAPQLHQRHFMRGCYCSKPSVFGGFRRIMARFSPHHRGTFQLCVLAPRRLQSPTPPSLPGYSHPPPPDPQRIDSRGYRRWMLHGGELWPTLQHIHPYLVARLHLRALN